MTTPSDPLARLRECPHCGGIAKMCETKVDFPTGSASAWRIWCDTPFCAMGMNSATREQCVTAWNRRAAHDTAQPGAGCNCKSANNPDGTSEPVLFTSETGKVYGVDACIAPVITELHRLGMPTRASCCGHGIQPPSVIMETDMDHYDCLRLLKRIDDRLWSVERVRP